MSRRRSLAGWHSLTRVLSQAVGLFVGFLIGTAFVALVLGFPVRVSTGASVFAGVAAAYLFGMLRNRRHRPDAND